MSLIAFNKKKKKENRRETARAAAPAFTPWKCEPDTMYAPASGQLIGLNQCSDPSFAQGLLGYGSVLIPEGNMIYAPVSGTIQMVFPAKSSLSIRDEKGREILLHLGMGTAALEGKPFVCFVQAGDPVVAGQPLMQVDWEKIDREGLSRETPIVLPQKEEVILYQEGYVQAGAPILEMKGSQIEIL